MTKKAICGIIKIEKERISRKNTLKINGKGGTAMNILAFSDLIVKWSDRKKVSLEVAARMKQAGFGKRGTNIEWCGDLLKFNKCPDCGRSELTSANFCRDRLCPTCAWRLSLRRYAEMCCVMGSISDKIKPEGAAFLTLTVRNCYPEDLKDTLQKMTKAWNRMTARRTIKPLFSGWARSVEVTYNAKNATFHPHFHIILILSEYATGLAEKVLRQTLSDAWYDAVQTDYRPITDYKVIDHHGDGALLGDDDDLQGAILETYKYTVKSGDLLEMPLSVFRTFVISMAGVRVASFGGCIKEARKILGYRDDDDREEDAPGTPGRACPDCGNAMKAAVLRWSMDEHKYNLVIENLSADEAPEAPYLG